MNYKLPQEEEFSLKSFIGPFNNSKIILLLIFFCFIVYGFSLENSFIGDDFDQIINNPLIHSPKNISVFFLGKNLENGFILSETYYKPLLISYFSLMYSLFSSHAFWYHFVQILFHSINSILLFFFFSNFFKRIPSFVLAVIFLAHSANAESVLYISAIQEPLFLFFGLITLLLWNNTHISLKKLTLGSFFLLCALFSKETGILFVFTTLLFTWFYYPKHIKKISISLCATLCIYFFFRFSTIGINPTGSSLFPIMQLSLIERLFHIPFLFTQYLILILWPQHLAFSQNWTLPLVTIHTFYLPLLISSLLIFVFLAFLFFLYRTKKEEVKPYIFFIGWFFSGIGIHLQIIPLDMTFAERWLYFPLIGFLGIAYIFYKTLLFSRVHLYITLFCTISIILGLSIRTTLRTFDWKNQFTLYSNDILVNPNSYNLQNGLASEYLEKKDYRKAKTHALISIRLKKDFCYSWNNLGVVYINEKNFQKAEDAFSKAISFGTCILAYENMATFFYFHKQPQETVSFITKAITLFPRNPQFWFLLSFAQEKNGNRQEALSAIKNSYLLAPNPQTKLAWERLQEGNPLSLNE